MHEYQYVRLTWHLFFTGFLFYIMAGFHIIEFIYLLAWVPDEPVMTTAVLMFHMFVLVRGYRVWKNNCSIHPEEWKRIMFFLVWYELDIIAVCFLQHIVLHTAFPWATVLFFLIVTIANMIYYLKKKYLFWLDENLID